MEQPWSRDQTKQSINNDGKNAPLYHGELVAVEHSLYHGEVPLAILLGVLGVNVALRWHLHHHQNNQSVRACPAEERKLFLISRSFWLAIIIIVFFAFPRNGRQGGCCGGCCGGFCCDGLQEQVFQNLILGS